ncbi:DNA double-strand break repair Rad50 ATPase [Actinidia chinensis var. chinensis]|uniref:DNA double-strand break repair Rad50 ATPase n=1 Tax=Actinidia chinensis var. chinensis TaxID=1590841 RepID=A0A2R6PUX7_ACTCC|nr:DNA double-strand break repair Rad50 ATPase [Actinidia chinensis var. chinensis]
MGCTQSKIENEETVARCKERRQYMKDAVVARNAFAAAHAAYAMSLKNAGAALSDYVHGEVQEPHAAAVVRSNYDSLPPPPPPLPNFTASPIQRAATMPEFSGDFSNAKLTDPIMEEENEDEIENESHSLKRRSSRSSGRGGGEDLARTPRAPPVADLAPPPPPLEDSKGVLGYDYIFPPMENVPGPSLTEVDEGRSEREEHERKMFEETSKRDERVNHGGARRSVEAEAEEDAPQPPLGTKAVRRVKQGTKGATGFNLLQIFNDLDDCFLKASESAHEVSKMLEANRLHYHSNFADNRETGEQMKLEYQKKVASLNRQKKHGASTEAIEKTKATVSHLHTRYIVDMQSMDSTVSEINRLRDEQLYPKLVALVDGMTTMWEAMKVHHENQSNIVIALRYLDISQSPKETSDQHHERTVQLWHVFQEWHSQCGKLMTHQRLYIKALNNWLNLNLIPVDTNLKEKVSSPRRSKSPPIQSLLHAWDDYLDKLSDELARTAISSFAAVVHTIMQQQLEEMKLRDKCADTRKELARRTQQYEDWYNKYMQKRTLPDEMDPEQAQDKDLIDERKLVVEVVKQRLEEDEEAYQKQGIQVREKSLTSLRTQLPELFRAMLNFSRDSSNTYKKLRSISHPVKPNASS